MESVVLGLVILLFVISLYPKRGRDINTTTIRYDISVD